MKRIINLAILATIGLGVSGCAYRSDSGINIPENIDTTSLTVLITESNLNNKNCKTIEEIDASVKKLTAFHADPTKEQVDYVLSEKAKMLNANVIRNVRYSSGIGFTTWGYMDAKGDASKCDLK
jgi:hypothetical protein